MTDSPTPQSLVDGLVRLMQVRQDGDDRFIGRQQKDGFGRVFGGQVIAQALMSAQHTVDDDRVAHSLHAYFLRGGKEGQPIDYATARDFDGRSFTNRRVVASQEGRPILNLTSSFQVPETGLSHDDYAIPDVPAPEDVRPDAEMREELLAAMPDVTEQTRAVVLRPRPLELRTVDKLHWMNSEPREPLARTWFRTVAPLPDDPALHRAIIAYASDYTLLGASALPHGLSWMRGELKGASLDHALWFHRPARADDWLLYETSSPWTGGGRGMNLGRIFNQSGELIASVAQEGVVRKAR